MSTPTGSPPARVSFNVEPRTRADSVVDALRREIVTGVLPAGARLRQNELAERFRVSTTPVREALRSLAREGFVRDDPHRGVVVFEPTPDTIRENYEIRMALEPLAAELAARSITDEEFEGVREALDELNASDDPHLHVVLNNEFHRRIYAASRRQQLPEMIDRLRAAAQAYVHILSMNPTVRSEDTARDEHAEILAALECRSPERARRAMEAHLSNNLVEISERLPT